jgi:hypothetical protein
MKIFPLLFCLVLFLAGSAAAQTNQNASCPDVAVSGGAVLDSRSPMTFTATVKNYDLSQLSFMWTISNGTILEGQETKTIVVDISKLSNSTNITATVEIKGLPGDCKNTASETGSVIIDYIRARLIDEFGNIPYEEVGARLDQFFTALRNEPNAQGYIINYGTDREKSRREAHLKRRIAIRKYDASRITFIRDGTNPNGAGAWTKFWIVPPGATAPTP